jgi:hypothetical protein
VLVGWPSRTPRQHYVASSPPPHHPFPRYLTQSLPILVIIAVVLALSAVRAMQLLQNRVFGGGSQTLLGTASVTSMGTSAVLAGMFMLYIGT